MKFVSIFATLLAVSVEVYAFAPSSISRGAAGVSTTTTSPIQYPATNKYEARQSLSQLFMGWGPDPIWESATITSTSAASASGNFVGLKVDVSADLVEAYKVPGQYVQVKQDINDEEGKVLFLAIASAPGAETEGSSIEFLVKKTDSNDWITNVDDGTAIAVSQVLGGGFPIEEEMSGFKHDFPLQNCLLFANGSGIAPIRAAIESGQLNIGKPGEGGRTARLYFGCTTPADMPYLTKFREWETNGIEVVPVISRPEECEGEWTGRTGYVQNLVEEDGVAIPRNTGALLCGVKGMAESIKDLLTTAGVFESRVMTNF